jgi:hypothetical protein
MYHTLVVPAVLMTAGLALCFFGRRIVPFALVLASLITALLYSGSFLSAVTDNPGILRFGPAVVAVLLAVLVSFLYRIAFFVAGFFIGFFISSALFPDTHLFLRLASALIAGSLVYVSRNFVFSVLTSVMGAGLAATGSVNLIAWAGISAGVTAYWIIFAVTAVTGVLYQTIGSKGRK